MTRDRCWPTSRRWKRYLSLPTIACHTWEIVVLFEGEEEIGSPNFESFVTGHRQSSRLPMLFSSQILRCLDPSSGADLRDARSA